MSEDIKKHRALMEQAFHEPMQTEASADEDMDIHDPEHMAQLLINMLKDSSPSTDELRDIVMGLKDMGHDNAAIHKVLVLAHQKLQGA